MNPISRREFVGLTALSIAAAPPVTSLGRTPPATAISAQEIVNRIRGKVGVEWKADTVDTFKAGDPNTAVKGIVTTSMATIPVLKQAIRTVANLVITCEPTFYSKSDLPALPAGRRGAPAPPPDPVVTAKNEF